MDSFVGAKWIAKGIEAVKGDVKDKNKFIQALRAVEITDAPHGKLKMDTYGQATQNMYVRKVENVKGRWQNYGHLHLSECFPVRQVRPGRLPQGAHVRPE